MVSFPLPTYATSIDIYETATRPVRDKSVEVIEVNGAEHGGLPNDIYRDRLDPLRISTDRETAGHHPCSEREDSLSYPRLCFATAPPLPSTGPPSPPSPPPAPLPTPPSPPAPPLHPPMSPVIAQWADEASGLPQASTAQQIHPPGKTHTVFLRFTR
eukprot:4183812-Prymnesium_polylepis.1